MMRADMSSAGRSRKRKIILYLILGILGLALLAISQAVCISAYLFDGILTPVCPDGDVVQTVSVEAHGLRRGADGNVNVSAIGHYTSSSSDHARATRVSRGVDAKVFFVEPSGKSTELLPREGWTDSDGMQNGAIQIPEVPDGEYTLRAEVDTPIGKTTQDLSLPVYAPAKVHVITDRPLYEPGNVVQFRAVLLRAKDLAPLDGRPGRWVVIDPNGETVLEEKSPAKEMGVASGSFPLDQGASIGEWRVSYVSGTAEDTITFRVEPFTLPRFSIEASPVKAFYRANEKPVVRGTVRYSSGAPVRDAEVEIVWSLVGAWPAPTDWTQGGLPKNATTNASGEFTLDLPRIPGDLRGRATLFARLAATDPAKDRVEGSATVLLSEDAIQVSAVTELDEGLVQGFNNRIYLRVTSASGAVLPNTDLVVRRTWEPNDKGYKAKTDEDGVAALQVDPGPPVNVVIPPMPYRVPPRPPSVARINVREIISEESPSLADLRVMDAWNNALAPCSRFVEQNESLSVSLRADTGGAIDVVTGDLRPLSRCAAQVLRDKKLAPTGKNRLYAIDFSVTSNMPRLNVEVNGMPVPDRVQNALHEAALDARVCLPQAVETGMLPRFLLWHYVAKTNQLHVRFAPDLQAEEVTPAAIASCVEAKLAKVEMPRQTREEDEESEENVESLGVARFSVDPAASEYESRPQAMTVLGYEMSISAKADNEDLGKTKIFFQPGQIPHLRLRASSVLAEPGQEIEVAILRGPSFSGEIPEKMWLSHERGSVEGLVDKKTRVVKFKLPDDAQGWFSLEFNGARALIYVKPSADLAVLVKSGADKYAPGDTAVLNVLTTSRGKGTRAAVGLFGVDLSLAQLAPLPGADDMGRVRPKAEMRSNAFEVLDASALALGRIRGANAAAATIQRVASVPARVDLDASIYANAQGSFDPVGPLTDHFYAVLSELHETVRVWEEKAPEGEQMHPETMARLWKQAMEQSEAKKLPVTDAFGRELRLHRLPPDLLALTDPRSVVVNGTRLPEDVENWSAWVKGEQP
jgi:hypothetical protein